MSIETIMARLERVSGGKGRYRACCPNAHSSKDPSLSVRVADDGRVLAHCFKGCSFDQIVTAVGLPSSEWFADDGWIPTPKPRDRAKNQHATLLIDIFKGEVKRGVTPSDTDVAAYRQALATKYAGAR